MKILIVCDPEEVRGTELSLYLKSEAERMNRRVVVLNAREVCKTPQNFDATIVVSEVQKTQFDEPVLEYVSSNVSHLNATPSFFLTVYSCYDENDLKVPDPLRNTVRDMLDGVGWKPQQAMILPVGLRLQGNAFETLTDWAELKISLQRFLIRNDLMMAS
jgi:menaquinone-dependent protoporphyrinogen IX oxidase